MSWLKEKRNIKPTSPSPPKLPKATSLLCPPRPEGGLPPLADGAGIGIGVGECGGSLVLGFGIWTGAEVADRDG